MNERTFTTNVYEFSLTHSLTLGVFVRMLRMVAITHDYNASLHLELFAFRTDGWMDSDSLRYVCDTLLFAGSVVFVV